jgi:hypothetical protein
VKLMNRPAMKTSMVVALALFGCGGEADPRSKPAAAESVQTPAACSRGASDFTAGLDGFAVGETSAPVNSLRQEALDPQHSVMTVTATLDAAHPTALALSPLCEPTRMRNKTVTADVFVEAPAPLDGTVSVGVALLDADTFPDAAGLPPCAKWTGPRGQHAFCAVAAVAPGVWTTVSFDGLPDQSELDAITKLEAFVHFGGETSWTGTVHFDNVTVH